MLNFLPSKPMSPISEDAKGRKIHKYAAYATNRSEVHTPINIIHHLDPEVLVAR